MINQKEFIALIEALEFSAIDFGEDRAKGIESNAQSLLAEYRRRVHSVIEKLETKNRRLSLRIIAARLCFTMFIPPHSLAEYTNPR